MAREIFDSNDMTTARGAARFLDIGEMQVSALLRKGKFGDGAQKVDGKWLISKAALEEYATAPKGARGQSANGNFKVTGWVSEEGLANLITAGWNFKKVAKGVKKAAPVSTPPAE